MTPDALASLHHHLSTALASPPAETRRLFHGRGRRFPGLEQITVDWLQGIVLVSLFRDPGEASLAQLKRMLMALADAPGTQVRPGVLLQHRYRPGSPGEWLCGEAVETWDISEHGLRFRLDLGRKQNTGLFLDMRGGRRWVQAEAEGRRVLNLFAYTCAFSVAAIAGGAAHVVNLDMASAALARGRDNHRLNGQDLARVSFLAHDLLRSWGRVGRLGPYDLIIVDPPSFQKGSFALTRDYRKILRRLPELLGAGGQVLACINDPEIGADFLLQEMQAEAPALVFQQRLDNPPEFADIEPEGGLKALVFRKAQ